jgi:hypothetical protein
LLYLPWFAYQRFVDPPGDRLLKWQLAGLIAPDRHSFLHDLVTQYLHHPLHSFVLNKLFNVARLFVVPMFWTNADRTWAGLLTAIRQTGTASLVFAVGPLLFSAFGLGVASVRRSLRPVRPLAVFVLVSIVFWVIVEFGGNDSVATTIHQGSYAVLVLVIALAALTATYLPRSAAVAVIGASLVWFGLQYLPGLGFQPLQPGLAVTTEWPMIGLGLGSLAALILGPGRSVSRNRFDLRLGRMSPANR